MSSLVSALQRAINSLLPFTNPERPLIQDIIHTTVLATLLYFGPQISERIRAHRSANTPAPPDQQAAPNLNDAPDTNEAPDSDFEPADPPPDIPFARHDGAAEANFIPDDAPRPAFQEQLIDDDEAGPADAAAQQNRANRAGRTVGAKKAKSLARRDQRRAYHEFQRAQGEAQRARDREGAEEREAALEKERERRAARESALEEQRRKEREKKKALEEEERLREITWREDAVRLVREALGRNGYARISDVAKKVKVEESRVEAVVKGAGVFRDRDDVKTVLTREGCIVRVDRETIEAAYQRVLQDSAGQIGWEKFGEILQGEITRRAGEVSAG